MTRLQPEHRARVIILAAVRVANSTGLGSVNHSTVCDRCTVATSKTTLKTHFPQISLLQLAVLSHPDADTKKLVKQARELGLIE